MQMCVLFLFFYTSKSCEIHIKSLTKFICGSQIPPNFACGAEPSGRAAQAPPQAQVCGTQDRSHRRGFLQISRIWVFTRFGGNGQKKQTILFLRYDLTIIHHIPNT